MPFCTGCKRNKPLAKFNKDSSKKSGHHTRCRSCTRKALRKLYGSKPRGPVRYEVPPFPDHVIKTSWQQKASRCRCSGIVFTLSLEQYTELYNVTVCDCCGRDIRHIGPGKEGGWSLDKMKPEMGYIPGNVFPVCNGCNAKKGNGAVEDLLKIIDYIRRHTEA